MSNEFIIFLFIGFFLASLVASYNMGWQSGHDVHHDDDMPRVPRSGPPPPPPTLYV